ncbi:MAG: M14-type cytosolic carboxypeptidase [Myxococcota bacterium]
MIYVSSHFDSGNIDCIAADDPTDVQLEIRRDAGENHFQWFHFRVTGARDIALSLRILNADKASYPKAWEGYQACASYDRDDWFRVETDYQNGVLVLRHTPEYDSVYYAYFAPYPLDRHAALLSEAQASDGVRLRRLGATADGRDLDLLQIGEAPLRCWIVARQHPGETMAEWLVEGLLDRLLDSSDPVARRLRERAAFYVVPNMNPDGSARGHLRNNATGANLNREWETPSLDRSPEVYLVREQMRATGVDFFLDVHGDETLPYNFIAGAEGIPSWTDAHQARQSRYLDALTLANPDFQTKVGYPRPPVGKANMTMASNWVGENFSCLAMTLEQPFKDTIDSPHPAGWSPERAKKLGAAQLDALLRVLDDLR